LSAGDRSSRPFRAFESQCEEALKTALDKVYPNISVKLPPLSVPPNPEFGELASSISFLLAKELRIKPGIVAQSLSEALDLSVYPLIERIEGVGGYLNFRLNFPSFTSLTLETVLKEGPNYGVVKTEKPRKVIVEHTSVNPIHPIHIGQARNSVLGDALARILKARGHTVSRHYYVDDVGRQSALIAYGYDKLGRPKPDMKPDHFIGAVYAITNCILELLKAEKEGSSGGEWREVAEELRDKHPLLFKELLEAIREDENPEEKVAELIRRYEAGEKEAKKLIREVCELCLIGFRETLSRLGIAYDSWDWESMFIWKGDVKRILEGLMKTPYVYEKEGVLEFDVNKAIDNFELRKKFGFKEDYEVPSLTLTRADGTSLYPTRDIAYSLWKFNRAEKVINVIGMEQKLPQLQLKMALYALSYKRFAENLIHFAYNLVRLPGQRMSGRRGRYVTLDEVIDEAEKRAFREVSERSPQLSRKEKRYIARFVGIGAIKYALVDVDPSKPVVFTWDRVLNFERNSAPYIQYSHARACSVIKKADRKPTQADYSLLREAVERELVLMLSRYPEVFLEAAENLKPHIIADFANNLADIFNSFYNSLPVIQAEPKGLSDARLVLVDAVRIVLANSLGLIGIHAPERM